MKTTQLADYLQIERKWFPYKDPTTGSRISVPKRHMMMTIAEAYALFIKDTPYLKLGKCKFYKLRPK